MQVYLANWYLVTLSTGFIRNGQICLHPMQSGSGNRLSINSGRKLNLFTNKEIRIMKKKILSATFVVAMAAIVGYSTFQVQNESKLTGIALSNAEALASGESEVIKVRDVYYPKPGDYNYGSAKCVCVGNGNLECC